MGDTSSRKCCSQKLPCSTIVMVLILGLLDIVTIQLLDRLPQERHPKALGLVLVPPEVLVEPPHSTLAEAPLEVLQEVGRVLVASVPVWANVSDRVGG